MRALPRAERPFATAREERSQHRNKALALERLAALLDARAALQAAGEAQMIHAAHRQVRRAAARPCASRGPAFEDTEAAVIPCARQWRAVQVCAPMARGPGARAIGPQFIPIFQT